MPEYTNLLPPERTRALARDYLVRLSVVTLWFVTALTLIAGVLLVPTYILLTQSARAKEAHLATLASSLSSAEEAALATRLAALSENAARLAALRDSPAISGIVREMLSISRSGIVLSGLSYTPPAALSISGSAATRNALRSYQLALQSAPRASAANLPVSAYAKDTDIAFTITVTLKP